MCSASIQESETNVRSTSSIPVKRRRPCSPIAAEVTGQVDSGVDI